MGLPRLKLLLLIGLGLLAWIALTVGTVRGYQAWQLHRVEHQTLREIIQLLNQGRIHVGPAAQPPAAQPPAPEP